MQTNSGKHHTSLEDLLEALRMECYCCMALWTYMTRRRAVRSKAENEQELVRIYGQANDATTETVCIQFSAEWRGGVNAPGISTNSWGIQFRLWEGLIWLKARIEVGERKAAAQSQDRDQHIHEAMSPVTINPCKDIALFNDMVELESWSNCEPNPIDRSFDQTWSLISKWLNKCTAQHKLCDHNIFGNMPTRVLEIMDTGKVRLRQTDAQSASRYATLSHCWGNIQPLRLTQETFATLKSGIETYTLPKTFQDAILICQKLRLSTLWIDSLCIFQDSAADWQSQSALMADVYANAFINIGASSAKNSSEGCFFSRDRTHVDLPVFNPKSWLHFGKPWFLLISSFNDQLDQQPLYRRGWVVQERLLAKRMVHFTQDQVWWECKEKRACETFPNSLPDIDALHASQRDYFHLTQSPESAREAYIYWMHAVENYSPCELTFPEDRLVAISGIAKKISPCFTDKPGYIAGLWEQFLPELLLWRPVNDSNGRSFENGPYISPTWSWASHRGSVQFRWKESFEAKSPKRFDLEVEETQKCLVANENAFGAIKHASLRLKALLLQVEDVQVYDNNYRPRYVAFNFDSTRRYRLRIRGMGASYQGIPHIGTDSSAGWQDLIARVKRGSIFALPVVVLNNPFPSGPLIEKIERSNVSTGLLVEKVETSVDEYRRVGCYDWWNNAVNAFTLRYRKALKSTNWQSVTLV